MLVAGQKYDAGTVEVSNDQSTLFVKYTTKSGWVLSKTRLAVTTSVNGFPHTKTVNPKVDSFPYQLSHNKATTYTYSLSLANLGVAPGTQLYIAAQADVKLLNQTGTVLRSEGAWGWGTKFPGKNWAMYFNHAVQACAAVTIEAGRSVMNIPVGESQNIAFVVNFSTQSSQTYHVEVLQSVTPDNGGLSFSTDYSAAWEANSPMTWVVNEAIDGNSIGTYTVTTIARIIETGAEAQTITTVNVTSGTENPVISPLGTHPGGIRVSTPTEVLFTTALSGSDVRPASIEIEQVDNAGLPLQTLGGLVDDGSSGDLLASDYVYSGRWVINSDAEGVLRYRAKATYPGIPGNVYSAIHKLPVTRFPTDVTPSDMANVVTDPATGNEFISNEIVISFVEGTTPETIELIVSAVSGVIVGTIPELGIYQVQIPGTGNASGVHEAIADLLTNPAVAAAQGNYIRNATEVVPNDPRYEDQWHLPKIRADEAWVVSRGAGIVIAVVDTGVDYNHPDLSGKVLLGHDYEDDDDDPAPGEDHGTHVAGIAAALSHNGTGVAGVAWNSKILAVRGFATDLMSGKSITYAVNNGAKVINCSYGGGWGLVESLAVSYADLRGRLVVAAAGNDNCSTPSYPGGYGSVLAVGATDDQDTRSIWIPGASQCTPNSASNFGDWVDIAAPGSGIWSTLPNGGYESWDGTSMATPIVSGAAALVWSLHPSWSDEQVRERLIKTAKPLSGQQLGAGRVDVFEAVFNGSFEMEDLAGWTVTGTASSLTSLGSLAPQDRNGHKKRMGYVSTGPSADFSSSKITQAFTVQSGVNSIPVSFDYNFVTEEYPEWVGTVYNDALYIRMRTPSGNVVTLATESVNTSTFVTLGGIDFPGGDNTVGMTGWKPVTMSVPVTEGAGTYEIFIEDRGDDIYDSVILIDNIRFK